ncbi:hypothetical protein [Cytobacillus firmus]|uniref:hypothetical protein n=1 Tax=Cytobacillus firmus TaxID=1399 RepID=UPI001F54A7F5|nr:hypothetical protein [Cytobacillus firmus]MBG9653893.1 hypothetical protein [Cytobacillus firmus]MED1908695.1 hypothetical protein [Cytobacillus firmus]
MLTKKQLDDIRSLQQISEETENIELKLNWDTLKSRPADEKNLHYGKSGMVRPDHRRKGIFTSLFNEAVKQLTKVLSPYC